MKRVEAILFSNGTDAEIWLGNNCDYCWKGNLSRSETLVKSRCGSCTDIIYQMIKGSEYKPLQKTVEAVAHRRCPQYEDHRPNKPVHAHRETPGQLQINFDV